jgi:hypothetical protein
VEDPNPYASTRSAATALPHQLVWSSRKSWLLLLAGTLITLSLILRLGYGPWGAELSFYRLISHNLTLRGWPILLVAWPVAFGAVVSVVAVDSLFVGGPNQERRNVFLLSGFLLSICIPIVALAAVGIANGLANSQVLLNLIPYCVVIFASVAILFSKHRRSVKLMMIGGFWTVVQALAMMVPNGDVAPACCTLVIGGTLVIVASWRQLLEERRHARGTPNN